MPNFLQSKVIANKKLTDKFHHLRFELQGEPFAFRSGQFVVVKVGENLYRSYSVASTPQTLPHWEIVIDTSPDGPGSRYFGSLKEGEVVQTTTPRGIFTLEDDGAECMVLGATGCGIASIKPMTEELLNKSGQEIYLLWGLRFEEDLFFIDLLESWKEKYPNFHYEVVLSKPGGGWSGKKGHITEHLEEYLKGQYPKKISVYLCGSGEMIKDVQDACERLQFPCDRIYFEKYS